MVAQNGNLGLPSGWNVGELGYGGPLTGAFNTLDALTQPVVISATTATPPTSPANGDAYIVPAWALGREGRQEQN